jgi:hypothetical protein
MKDGASRACGRGSRLRRGGSTVAVLAGLAIFASACGGSTGSTPGASGTSSGVNSRYTEALAYSECMRSHGIANFPNPNSAGGIVISNVNNGINQNSPQYLAANKTCEKLLPNGGQLSPAQENQVVNKALKFAECMRSHGLSKFPDPIRNGSGGSFNLNGSGIDPLSPQFKSAIQACQKLGLTL